MSRDGRAEFICKQTTVSILRSDKFNSLSGTAVRSVPRRVSAWVFAFHRRAKPTATTLGPTS